MSQEKSNQILELAALLSGQADYQEILRLVIRKTSVLLDADTALIMMVNPVTRETVKTIIREGSDSGKQEFQTLHIYLTGWVIEHNSGFFTIDLLEDRRFITDALAHTPVGSVICAPLRWGGSITGTLLLLNPPNGHQFTREDLDILEKLSSIVSPYLLNTQKIQEYFARPIPEEALIRKYEAHGLLGRSKKFIELLHAIEAASASGVRVIMEGQSGTGKELVARAIHHNSARSGKKFVAIDCGAIPAELLESELFGHVKGAFTGAGGSRKGLIEEADGGSLFLDEITNLPLNMQSKLLRVLQEKEIRPLGSNQLRKIDVRIIAASSSSLRELVEKGEFREDLYYRLFVYPLSIPTLNERREDITYLAEHFLKLFSRDQRKKLGSLSPEIIDFFEQRQWKGNVRELENLMERIVALAPASRMILEMSMLPGDMLEDDQGKERGTDTRASTLPLHDRVAEYEKELLEEALNKNGWNQSATARALRISEHAIRYKMKILGISRPN